MLMAGCCQMPRVDRQIEYSQVDIYIGTIMEILAGPHGNRATRIAVFVTPFSQSKFKVMPFGLQGSTFQRMIDNV